MRVFFDLLTPGSQFTFQGKRFVKIVEMTLICPWKMDANAISLGDGIPWYIMPDDSVLVD